MMTALHREVLFHSPKFEFYILSLPTVMCLLVVEKLVVQLLGT